MAILGWYSIDLSVKNIPRIKCTLLGRVVELVDTLVLGTSVARREGSSPFSPTIFKKTSNIARKAIFVFLDFPPIFFFS